MHLQLHGKCEEFCRGAAPFILPFRCRIFFEKPAATAWLLTVPILWWAERRIF